MWGKFFTPKILSALGIALCLAACSKEEPKPLYLFTTKDIYRPSLGGRAGANALCASEMTSQQSKLGCSSAVAFISIAEGDAIRDLPTNYSVNQDIPVLNKYGEVVLDSLSDLINNSEYKIRTAVNREDLSSDWRVCTGSTTNGSFDTFAAKTNCDGFTTANPGGGIPNRATFGYAQTTEVQSFLAAGDVNCGIVDCQVYCLCW